MEKRSRIYTLIQEGYSSREIANRENVDHATVLRIKKRKEETGSFDVAQDRVAQGYLPNVMRGISPSLLSRVNVQMRSKFKKSLLPTKIP